MPLSPACGGGDLLSPKGSGAVVWEGSRRASQSRGWSGKGREVHVSIVKLERAGPGNKAGAQSKGEGRVR